MKTAERQQTTNITPIAPGIVPGLNNLTHRLIEAEDTLQAGDEFSPLPGIWHAVPAHWLGKQAGQIFHLPGGEAIADRSVILIKAPARRQKPRNLRRQASMARRFAQWIGLPVVAGTATTAAVLLLAAFVLLCLGGCVSASPYASPYAPAASYQYPNSYRGQAARLPAATRPLCACLNRREARPYSSWSGLIEHLRPALNYQLSIIHYTPA
jgi:hypothetical protein